MSKDKISRVTVFRMKIESNTELVLRGYNLVHSGAHKATDKSLRFWLYFLDSPRRAPKWFSLFASLELPKENIPKTQDTGFALLIQVGKSFYAVSGGLAHIELSSQNKIEHQFGSIMAEKMLSLPELRGLVQRDTSGVVNRLDRNFRSSYDPGGEIDNLRRVLSSVRGRLDKENPLYSAIGKSITAGNSLTVNGSKSLAEIFQLVAKIEEIWQVSEKRISIPKLEQIEKKFHGPLLLTLEERLVSTLASYTKGASLILDSDDLGFFFLPDRVSSYQLLVGRSAMPPVETSEEVFQQVAEALAALPGIEEQKHAYNTKMRLKVVLDDTVSTTKKLSAFICGDVTCDDEVFFVNNQLWYRADEKFVEKLDREIDNIQFLPPAELGLLDWDSTRFSGMRAEYNFNEMCSINSGLLFLDCRTVMVPGEKGTVEFCDLMKADNSRVELIHVKKANGAELRALFAQGFVAAKLYSESADFRTWVHTASLTGAVKMREDEKTALGDLKGRQKREFRIVFAIFDETPSNSVATGARLTSQMLNGTLTPFSKVDLLERAQTIRAMGYDVAVTRIGPYPS